MIAIYPLIVLGLVVAALRRPATAVGGVLCLFGLKQWAQSQSAFFVAHGALTNLAIGGIALLALLTHLIKGEKVFAKYPPVGWVVLGLYLFTLLSVIWSANPEVALGQWRLAGPLIITGFVLAPLLISRPHDLRDALVTTLVLGSLVLLLLLASHRSGRFIALETVDGSASQIGNPLAIGSLSAYVTLIAILMNFSGSPRFWVVLRWLIIALGLVSLIMSEARGQLGACLLSALCFFPLSRRPKTLLGFVTIVAGAGLLAILAGWLFGQFATSARWNVDALKAAFVGGAMADPGRLSLWIPLFEYWINSSPIHWIIGLGNSSSFNIVGFYPHFVFLEVLTEEGIVGATLLGAILLITVHSLFRLSQLFAHDQEPRSLVAIVGALFFFETILSCKEGSFLGNVYVFAFALIIARFEWAVRQRLHSTSPTRTNRLDATHRTVLHATS